MRRLTTWWQKYVAGHFTTPQQVRQAALSSIQARENHQLTAFNRFMGDFKTTDKIPAPERLKDLLYLASDKHLRDMQRADWQHVDPRLMLWQARFIISARRLGIPLYAHGAFRTKEAQDAMVQRGVSKARWPAASHCVGAAVDIVHGTFAWNMSRDEWLFLHKLGREAERQVNNTLPADKKLSLTWGGNWKFYDPAHWEIANWQTRSVPNIDEIASAIRRTPSSIMNGYQIVTPASDQLDAFNKQMQDREKRS